MPEPLSTPPLRFVSYVVLALVGERGAGAHDVVRMVRQGSRLYARTAPSQIYAEALRLEHSGYLVSEEEPGRTTERTVYRLTDRGRETLRTYLRSPSPFPRFQQEVTLRLLAGDMITDAEVVASVTAMRDEIAEVEAVLAEMERQAAGVPHRERYLRLQHSLGRRLLRVYREWVDEVEAELTAAAAPSTS